MAPVKLAVVKVGAVCTGQLFRISNKVQASPCIPWPPLSLNRQMGWLSGLHRLVRVCVGSLGGCGKELPGTDYHTVPVNLALSS